MSEKRKNKPTLYEQKFSASGTYFVQVDQSRALEILNSWFPNRPGLVAENKALREEILSIRRTAEKLREACNGRLDEIKTLRDDIHARHKQYENLKVRADRFESEWWDCSNLLDLSRQHADKLRRRLKRKKAAIRKLKEEINK